MNCLGQKQSDYINGHKLILTSDTLQQEREIYVSLPKSYADTVYSPKDYPVLYLLDAQEHFDLAIGIVRFMSTRLDSKMIPECIIVGIPSINRIKDYTPTYSTKNPEGVEVESFENSGSADDFLAFIKHELIPKIDKKYRTTSFRILSGHSLGGLFAVYESILPESYFNAHVAMDPSLWWNEEILTRRVNFNETALPKRLYISGAHNSDMAIDTTPMRKSQVAFYNAVNSKNDSMSKVKYRIYDNEDHGMVPLPSLYNGLQFVFENYKMSNMIGASAEEIQEHFVGISNSIGIKLLPSERVIDILGNYFIGSGEFEKGISLLKLNTKNYPDSYHAYYSLGKAFKVKGDSSKAIINYKKSLELKADSKVVKQEFQELTGQNKK